VQPTRPDLRAMPDRVRSDNLRVHVDALRFPGPLRLVFAARPPAEAERPECARHWSRWWSSPSTRQTAWHAALALTAERVTDLMNERAEYEFVDAFVQSFQDDLLSVSTLIIARDEILAVG